MAATLFSFAKFRIEQMKEFLRAWAMFSITSRMIIDCDLKNRTSLMNHDNVDPILPIDYAVMSQAEPSDIEQTYVQEELLVRFSHLLYPL